MVCSKSVKNDFDLNEPLETIKRNNFPIYSVGHYYYLFILVDNDNFIEEKTKETQKGAKVNLSIYILNNIFKKG